MAEISRVFDKLGPNLALGSLSAASIISSAVNPSTTKSWPVDTVKETLFKGSASFLPVVAASTGTVLPGGTLVGEAALLEGKKKVVLYHVKSLCGLLSSVDNKVSVFRNMVIGLRRACALFNSRGKRTLSFTNHRKVGTSLSKSLSDGWGSLGAMPRGLRVGHPNGWDVKHKLWVAQMPLSNAYAALLPQEAGASQGIYPNGRLGITWDPECSGLSAPAQQEDQLGSPEVVDTLNLLTQWVDLLVAVPLAALNVAGFANNVAVAGGVGTFSTSFRLGKLWYHHLSVPPFWARSPHLCALVTDQLAFAVNTFEDKNAVRSVLDEMGGSGVVRVGASGTDVELSRVLLERLTRFQLTTNRALVGNFSLGSPYQAALIATLCTKEAPLTAVLPPSQSYEDTNLVYSRIKADKFLSAMLKSRTEEYQRLPKT